MAKQNLYVTYKKYGEHRDKDTLRFSTKKELKTWISEKVEETKKLEVESDECGESLFKWTCFFMYEDKPYEVAMDF